MPEWVIALFRTGTIVDIAIAILIAEAAVLSIVRSRLDRRALLFNALSGIALLLALRSTLHGVENYHWVAICLAVGFAAHIGDVVLRATSGR